MPGILEFLRTEDVPPAARRNYLIELRHVMLWGVFANVIDGSFSSIVVAKTFGASPFLIALVWSTPMLAHALSIVWSAVLRGRPKVRTYLLLAAGALLSSASILLTPSDLRPWGGWIFALQIALARFFLSGIVNVRTSIWRANYPQTHRARIAGRIQMLNGFLALAMFTTISLIFDRHSEYYRIAYPAVAVVGTIALFPLRRLRVSGEAEELRALHAHGAATPGNPWQSLKSGIAESFRILRRDKAFAEYIKAQNFLGSANFMVDPVLTVVLVHALNFGYFSATLVIDLVAMIVMLATIGMWARLFDRAGVLHFRVINSAVWLTSIVLVTIGVILIDVAPHMLPAFVPIGIGVVVLGRIVNGVGRGGGQIAWNLGHLHFAAPRDAELYMGIHVTATGLRGIVMPFVGSLTYSQCAKYGAGWISFVIAVGLSIIAQLLFRRLALQSPTNRPALVPLVTDALPAETAQPPAGFSSPPVSAGCDAAPAPSPPAWAPCK